MSVFCDRLKAINPPCGAHAFVYVPYDQLNADVGLLAEAEPSTLGVILIETKWKPSQRKYHKQKLALLLSNQRHFALEIARRGYHVKYVFDTRSYGDVLRELSGELGSIAVMEPAEYELRQNLQPLLADGVITPSRNPFWLTENDDFIRSQGKHRKWRMDRFYRHVRKQYQVLLDTDGKPVGGKWSHDADNRKPWNGQPAAPSRPSFELTDVTREVCELIDLEFGDHPGCLDRSALPSTREHADALWSWACAHCMTFFGPYEDAMSTKDVFLFHTNISSLMNLGRLLPRTVVSDVLALDIPLNSKEGFVRQVLGWREFVRHVHRETAGLRDVDDEFRRMSQTPEAPSFLGANQPLPAAFWGQESGFKCLDHVVGEVWTHGYTHHINRLMILSNWATLLDVSPRELSDWFWVAFTDAYDWVVEPNVIGMGTFGLGELMTTKPYVSGSAYVNKMSDYCKGCQFCPKTTCPMTSLYWAFLKRHEETLSSNPRLSLVMGSCRKRSEEKQAQDAQVAADVMAALGMTAPAIAAGDPSK